MNPPAAQQTLPTFFYRTEEALLLMQWDPPNPFDNLASSSASPRELGESPRPSWSSPTRGRVGVYRPH
jgi:hypothetical protein